ncbi:MAG: hypothetical protein CMJ18_23240 [Phycisphaeraceae bacterium]|nr:hypothetical protein [Phycisphaeraceae bacterium]
MNRILALVIVFGCFGACSDQDARKRAAAQAELEQTLQLALAAERGFVPANAKDPETGKLLPFQEHRQQEIEKIRTRLQAAVRARVGSRDQQTAVKRMLAAYQGSAARHLARGATTEWSQMDDGTAKLLGDLMRLGQLDALVRMLEHDETPLRNEVERERKTHADRQTALAADVEQGASQIEQLESEIERLTEQKHEVDTAVAKLRERAFTQKGQERFDTHKEVEKGRMKSAHVQSEIQVRELRLAGLKSTWDIDSKRLDAHRDAAAWLGQQVTDSEGRESAVARLRAEVDGKKTQEGVAIFDEKFKQLQDRYVTGVDGQFDKAATLAGDAVSLVQGGRTSGPAGAALLSAYLTQLHVVSQQVVVSGSYARILELIRIQSEGLGGDYAERVAAVAEKVVGKQAELIEQCDTIRQAASELAGNLADGDGEDPVVQIATKHKGYLDDYGKRIDEARIESP